MPTAAELALQKKYAEMRAKKQQQAGGLKATSVPLGKRTGGPVRVTIKSKPSQAAQRDQQSPAAAKQTKAAVKHAAPVTKPGPKITLRTHPSKPPAQAGQQKTSAGPRTSSGAKVSATSVPPSNPQSAALEAAKKVLAARQAAVEKDKAAHSTAPKRPSFKRPTVKRPAPAVTPTEEVEAGQASKKPRLDTLFQQSSVQSSKPHEHVTASTDASQAWSPTQHTDLPYSPGAEGTAWSPTAAYQAPQQGYSPSHHTDPAAPAGYGQASEQGYSYTGAGQPSAGPASQQCDQADRTVFVGNIPDDVSDMELAEYFCELGEVLAAQIRGNEGGHYGFVEFAYPQHVQQVLSIAEQQPFMLGGNYLRVQPRRPKESCQGSAPPPLSQEEPADYEYERKELPAERAARVKAELAAAAAAAVDELDFEELRSIVPAPPPDRQLMVYDDI